MKDKELEEILKNNSNGYIGLYDNAWEYNGEYPFPMEEITKALLAWRDNAVREARIDELKRVSTDLILCRERVVDRIKGYANGK